MYASKIPAMAAASLAVVASGCLLLMAQEPPVPQANRGPPPPAVVRDGEVAGEQAARQLAGDGQAAAAPTNFRNLFARWLRRTSCYAAKLCTPPIAPVAMLRICAA